MPRATHTNSPNVSSVSPATHSSPHPEPCTLFHASALTADRVPHLFEIQDPNPSPHAPPINRSQAPTLWMIAPEIRVGVEVGEV